MHLWVPYLDIEGKIIQQRKDSLFNNWWASLVAHLVKNACNAGDLGLIPGLGRSPGEGNGKILQYPCLENPMDRGAWCAAIHGIAKSWA